MKACRRFATIKADFERDVSFLRGHAERHQGSASAKSAVSVKRNMARALNTHLDRCRECG
ncbi:hypothetical protein [Streptomyces sp. BK205]|uniref:hypothetical protein n=1 Tax=Streptomyces sp. BK205 TaxID=2512164 RepID=UPI001048D520|nr:hypothetical protein [Streptomyces sp. BK205]TCR22956.1 hypothetical protein EV578_104286 [Streptomyces sp. BK205]